MGPAVRHSWAPSCLAGDVAARVLARPAEGALGFASALSLPYLLDTGIEPIAQAVDGDPETAVEQPA